MDSDCPSCHAPLVGTSCYQCSWPSTEETSSELSSHSSATSYEGQSQSFVPPSHNNLSGDNLASSSRFSHYPAPPDPMGSSVFPNPTTDFADQPNGVIVNRGRTSSAENIFEEQFILTPPPANTHANITTSMTSSSSSERRSLVPKLVERETISGRVDYVSDVTHESAPLAAFYLSGRLAMGFLLLPFRLVAFVLGLFFRPLRFLLGAGLMGGGRGHRGPDSVDVPVHRFRVHDASNQQLVECVLRGQLSGGAIYIGEDVEMTGKFDSRTRTFIVNRLVNASTGAVTTGSVDPRVRSQYAMLASVVIFISICVIWFLA